MLGGGIEEEMGMRLLVAIPVPYLAKMQKISPAKWKQDKQARRQAGKPRRNVVGWVLIKNPVLDDDESSLNQAKEEAMLIEAR